MLSSQGFAHPTRIQAQVRHIIFCPLLINFYLFLGWPMAMSGRDMVGIAATGSGKTLAYILPAIVHINAQAPVRRGDGPVALILAPTRELAMQIHVEAQKFGKYAQIRSTLPLRWNLKGPQSRDLAAGVEICIATPGRLLDILNENRTNLRRVTYLVMDEADRMLDMGFEPQIRKILESNPSRSSNFNVECHLAERSSKLGPGFLEDFIQVNIGSLDISANVRVTQIVLPCSGYDKMRMLIEELSKIMSGPEPGKVIIFTAKKVTADEVSSTLSRDRFPAVAIHG